MPSRRAFIQATSAAAMAFAHAPALFAAKYDVLIRGGRVLDASQKLDRIATKGTIHKNTAARKRSRLAKRLNAAKAKASAGGKGA